MIFLNFEKKKKKKSFMSALNSSVASAAKSDIGLVKSDIRILVKVVKGSDNEHTVCLLNFGGNVLVKFKVILEYYS